MIFPLSLKNKLCRYWYCFGVGSRPYTVRDAMFVDKFVVLVGKPVLLALAVERDFGPLELAVGVAERTGAVLFRFCRFDALCISNGASVLDLALNFLLVSLAPGFTASSRCRCQRRYFWNSYITGGRGPTRDISPFSTFQNCGNSSRLVFRRKRPIGVTRGSLVNL